MTAPLGPPNGHRPSMPPQPAPGNELVNAIPLMFTMWQAPAPPQIGGQVVVMRIACALGPLHFILMPDEAIKVGGMLRQQGKASKSGLTLPPGARLPDDDDDIGPTIEDDAPEPQAPGLVLPPGFGQDKLSADQTVDVDLDVDVVVDGRGERITEAGAEELAQEILDKTEPGRARSGLADPPTIPLDPPATD